MGVFRSKDSSISQSIINETNNSSVTGNAVRDAIESSYNSQVISSPLSAAIDEVAGKPVTDGEITYTANSSRFFLNAIKLKEDQSKASAARSSAPLDYWDIAQSHFFTVEIDDKLHDVNGSPFQFASGKGTYQNYIPLKSMTFSSTSYENMNVPFGIFGDFPLLHRKKVTTINFSCYDIDQDSIEIALREWEKSCFPSGTYVAFLDEIAAKLCYNSYDVKGKLNFSRVLYVIPASTVSVSRSYEENGPKLLNFSVVAVGADGANALSGMSGTDKGGDGRENIVKQDVYALPSEHHITDDLESNEFLYTDNTGNQY